MSFYQITIFDTLLNMAIRKEVQETAEYYQEFEAELLEIVSVQFLAIMKSGPSLSCLVNYNSPKIIQQTLFHVGVQVDLVHTR